MIKCLLEEYFKKITFQFLKTIFWWITFSPLINISIISKDKALSNYTKILI